MSRMSCGFQSARVLQQVPRTNENHEKPVNRLTGWLESTAPFLWPCSPVDDNMTELRPVTFLTQCMTNFAASSENFNPCIQNSQKRRDFSWKRAHGDAHTLHLQIHAHTKIVINRLDHCF